MNKKVCVVTWPTSINYGTCIQAYALTEYLRKMDCDVYVPDSYRYYYGIRHPIETFVSLLQKVRRKEKKTFSSSEYERLYEIRLKKNIEFAQQMTGVVSFCSKKNYLEVVRNTDVFISGSDQIWNPSFVTPPMLLSFSGKRKKIAYGSSIGVSHIPFFKRYIYRKYLTKFESIGVREETAKEVLSKFVDARKFYVVLDPSFLLNRDDWDKISLKPDGIDENSEFIFCYFIGENTEWIDDLEKYLITNPQLVVCMPSEALIIPERFNCICDAGVREFIWCILHAKHVFTDSFHATALAINFNTSFTTYKRFMDSDQKSQNSRIINLLNQFELQECLNNKGIPMCITRDFSQANSILEELRTKSFKFIEKGITNHD